MDNLQWIQSLAKNELMMEEKGIADFPSELDTQSMIEEATIRLLGELRSRIESYAEVFNSIRDNNTGMNLIKIYRISNTAADFMIFRNSLKLIFANTDPGVINISFLSYSRNTVVFGSGAESGQGKKTAHSRQGDNLMAQMGSFGEIYWSYRGEKVNPEYLARYYVTEFIKHSAR